MRRFAYFIAGLAAGLAIARSIERLSRDKLESTADSIEKIPASFEAFEGQQADSDMRQWRMIAAQQQRVIDALFFELGKARAMLRRICAPSALKPPASDKLRLN